MGGTGSFSDKDNCPLSAVIGEGHLLTFVTEVLISPSAHGTLSAAVHQAAHPHPVPDLDLGPVF